VSRKSAIIFGQGAILEPSTPHIGREVALVARTAAFVYMYARISQIAEIHTSFYATGISSGMLVRRAENAENAEFRHICSKCIVRTKCNRMLRCPPQASSLGPL
jgi:hypothetical protein